MIQPAILIIHIDKTTQQLMFMITSQKTRGDNCLKYRIISLQSQKKIFTVVHKEFYARDKTTKRERRGWHSRGLPAAQNPCCLASQTFHFLCGGWQATFFSESQFPQLIQWNDKFPQRVQMEPKLDKMPAHRINY